MATRLKTVEFWLDTLSSVPDAVVTNFTVKTLYLPENSKTIKSVHLECFANDIITATGGTITEWRLGLRLGAAGYTTNTNLNDITHSGENLTVILTADFTSHFVTNWTGTSMTCDVQVYIDQSTGTTLGMRDVNAKLVITYEYDDTSTTQIKTVFIPLATPNGALATTKPGTAITTIPALDTFCPEASKTYRDWAIVVQGNDAMINATDYSISMQLDAAGASVTTGLREGALISNRWFRYVWSQPTFTTNATHDFFIWGSQAKGNHLQAWLVVTYEFDEASTTNVLNSLKVAMEFASPMGGTVAGDAQRASRALWIQEPGTITIQQSALMLYWDQAAAIAGLNARVGAASYTTFTDTAATLCGGNGAMLRCESDVTLARGKNTLQADIYRTDATDIGMNVSGMWMLNYTSGKASSGTGAHNHTVNWGLFDLFTAAASALRTTGAVAPGIPASEYFLSAVGINYVYLTTSTGTAAGVGILAERKSAEGGPSWEEIYKDIGYTDPEAGVRQCWAQARSFFKRWPGDMGPDRVDIEATRRWRVVLANNCLSYDMLDMHLTFHSIKNTISGAVTGYTGDGSGITVDIFRVENNEHVLQATTITGGTFSATWYDDTALLYAHAVQDSTHLGRSNNVLPTVALDIAFASGGGGGNTYSRGRVVNA